VFHLKFKNPLHGGLAAGRYDRLLDWYCTRTPSNWTKSTKKKF